MMTSKSKLWFGIGAFILVGGDAAALPPEQTAGHEAAPASSGSARAALDAYSRSAARFAQALGGEAGEGGEGGEAGINVEAAANDPVEYGIALQVIAAHVHAGLAAYRNGEKEAGAQMFAHGLSEIYVEMEEVFKQRGVTGLGEALQAAVDAGTAKRPVPELRRRVRTVYAALAVAEQRAPKSALSPQAVRAQVAAEMIERAAAQYAVVQKDWTLEAYLDGFGFAVAAGERAKEVLPWLRRHDRAAAETLRRGVALAAAAFPPAKRPGKAAASKVKAPDLLIAASRAKLAVSGLK